MWALRAELLFQPPVLKRLVDAGLQENAGAKASSQSAGDP
jgi:hypothetical protein